MRLAKVLRPPTFAALEERLAAAVGEERPFHVVHFDGHGASPGGGGGPGVFDATGGEAVALFETDSGGQDPVPAGQFARVLADGWLHGVSRDGVTVP